MVDSYAPSALMRELQVDQERSSCYGLDFLHCASPQQVAMRKLALRKTLLALARVLRLGEIDEHVGHEIPGVADTHDHEQQHCRSDDEQSRCFSDGE